MKKMFITVIVLVTILYSNLFAHTTSSEGELQHFTIQNKQVDGYFYMFKNNEVYLENTNHKIVHFPISYFSEVNQNHILNRYKIIETENTQLISNSITKNPTNKSLMLLLEILGALGLIFFVYQYLKSYSLPNKMKYVYPIAIIGLATLLISADKKYRSTTDPIQVDKAFIPFKPNVYTYWDNTWFYVESKGIPTSHVMMVGISNHGWQQQIPIPQCYTGSNAWQIPLNPIPAATPIPVNANHFTRGAIALAVNGIPIFNPFTNTGVDALVDGQLDNYGGHCGRADDYHYHTAPLHLYGYTNDTLPIAYALDGYAVFGAKERDGSSMATLDANHGHSYGGVYHYHGTTSFPYMIENMVGQITEDTTHQIIPQAHATPIRPSGTPLNGALISGCTPKPAGNGYVFTYILNGQTYTIDYSWNTSGVYTFTYITPNGTTVDTYTKFVQCNIPNAIYNITQIENEITVSPNPTTDFLNINLKGKITENEIQEMSIYNLQGQKVFSTNQYTQHIPMENLANGNYIFKVQIGTTKFSKMINKN